MTYPEAIDWLYGLRLHGMKLGLENPRRLAGQLGNPHDSLNLIHVAGTNGKGSVCAMLESIYRAAGFKTGLFTSPHLISFRERIQINRQLIDEAEVVSAVGEMQIATRTFPAGQHPTFFEVVTVMALKHFAENKCDIVLLETGLGGRLDATNIVTPIVTVLTPIALDHQQWLGDTLTQIAAEKAGILKPHTPTFSASQSPAARAVLEATAAERDAPLTFVDNEASTNLAGHHQQQNAALAAAVVRGLRENLPADNAAIEAGLANVQLPARAQLIETVEGRYLIDAAHNPAGAVALREVLAGQFAGVRPTLLIGMLADKDWQTVLGTLAPGSDRVICVPVGSGRALPANEMAEAASQHSDDVSIADSLAEGMKVASGDDLAVIAGSVYLAGEALEWLGQAGHESHRDLNEWKT